MKSRAKKTVVICEIVFGFKVRLWDCLKMRLAGPGVEPLVTRMLKSLTKKT